ncbi:hypothetical protein M758_2G107500, partial [Ceratodon purpureus]
VTKANVVLTRYLVKAGSSSAKRWISSSTHMVFISSKMLCLHDHIEGRHTLIWSLYFYCRYCRLQKLELDHGVLRTMSLPSFWHADFVWRMQLNIFVLCFVGRYLCALLD